MTREEVTLCYQDVTKESLGDDVTFTFCWTHTVMFNVNLVTAKMKLQVESQDGSVLVAQVPVVTTLGAGPTALRHQPDNRETRPGVDNTPSC